MIIIPDPSYVKVDTNLLKDPSINSSYEENGVMKISNDILVPDYLVSVLMGRDSENIKTIMNKTGAIILFQKEVELIKLG